MVIVGGGVMGCAIALRLASRGLEVMVLERSVPGAEASSVAAGILAPCIEHGDDAYARELGVASRELHASLARELAELGLSSGFRRSGAMRVAFAEAERTTLASSASLGTLLDGDAARRIEPRLAESVIAALDLPEEAQCEPRLLLRGLAIAAERAGARFSTGAIVRGVRVERERVVGVDVEGMLVPAGHVIVAAGSWTSLVPGLGASGSVVRPVRGQLVHLDARSPLVSRVLFGASGYVVPRADGRVVCGATTEEVGFASEVTAGGVATVLSRALRVVPALSHARFVSADVSFRPGSPDDRPLVGPAGPEGLWLATGHYRNGILLAPITAAIIAAQLVGEPPPIDVAQLDPRRFA